MGIGADVAVERTIKKTKEELDIRITQMEKTRDTLVQQLNQVIRKIQENRQKLEEIALKLREGERLSGVREAKKRT